MDFLDPNKKRAHKRKLFIGYILMAIAIGLGAIVLLYAAYGYGVDRQGNVFQNGLVFVASTPDAAEVSIKSADGQRSQKAITSERLVLPAGTYNFEFLKQGYKPWQRTIELRGGDVQRLVYPFLFPETFRPSDVTRYDELPGFVTVSPDRSTILVQRPENVLNFEVINANNPEEAAETFALPRSLLSSGRNRAFSLVEWSTNNRHLLVKHTFDKKTEYILIDRANPNESININKHFNLNPKRVLLRDKNPDQLYIQQPNNQLLTADVSERSTDEILKSALDFQPHGDNMLLYVASGNGVPKGKVGVYIFTDQQSYKLREIPTSPTYLLDLAQHNNSWLVAAGASSDNRVYVYRNPITFIKANNPKATMSIRTMRITNPTSISFSANAQFIAVQSGQSFDVYDAQEDRQYHFTVNTPFDKNSGPAKWMDGHRLLTSTGGKVTVFDFDGSNYQLLTAATPGYTPMFDRDYTRMYSIAPSQSTKGKQALVQTPLRVEE